MNDWKSCGDKAKLQNPSTEPPAQESKQEESNREPLSSELLSRVADQEAGNTLKHKAAQPEDFVPRY